MKLKNATWLGACVLGAALLTLPEASSFAQSAADMQRVVTTINQEGKSAVLFNAPVDMKPLPAGAQPPGERLATVWATEKSPADFVWGADRAATVRGFGPPAGGSDMLIIEFQPAGPEIDKLPLDTLSKVVDDKPLRGLPPSHPLMHRTRTVDYVIVLSGEIDMILDTGTVHLKTGDVVVQQATNHAWVNRGTVPCRLAVVMIDAREP